MKNFFFIFIVLSVFGVQFFNLYGFKNQNIEKEDCVFNTVFGEVELDSLLTFETPPAILSSVDEGLKWLKTAQQESGGWGAGHHGYQRQMDPHKVEADPATTAMVAMSLLRTGSDLDSGPYHEELLKATEYLLKAVELAPANGKITALNGTQIQRKLGDNIDLVLSTQYLTNLLDHLDENTEMYERIFNALNKGIDMVETHMTEEGRIKGAGWAGVLQSAFATNALESAEAKGVNVNMDKFNKSKKYQSSNYDPVSERVETKDGAGVVLYAVSGSVRANAKASREAKEIIKKAKLEGVLSETAKVNYDNLVKSGINEKEAMILETANNVYNSAKLKAQDKKTMEGFGNNGGEEFLSFLQTGESLVINDDESWTEWYDMMSANLVKIQNANGSWSGHHCITSPVFCTATCILTLTINDDIENLLTRGE